jgi:hypothetical protein
MCEFFIIVFVGDAKIWTFHSLFFKLIIYFVAHGGHKDKWYIKFLYTKKCFTMNTNFRFIDVSVAIVG